MITDALAVYRLTKLATSDSLTQPLRERVVEFAYTSSDPAAPSSYGAHRWQELVEDDRAEDRRVPRLADLATCPACASVWCAFLALALRRLSPRLWSLLSRGLALSAAAGLLGRLEGL